MPVTLYDDASCEDINIHLPANPIHELASTVNSQLVRKVGQVDICLSRHSSEEQGDSGWMTMINPSLF